MNLSSLVQNDLLQLAVSLAELIGLLAVTIKIVTGFLWPRLSRGRAEARLHFERVIDLSLEKDSYLAACTLIVTARMMTALFFVLTSLSLLVVSFLLRSTGDASGTGWLNGVGVTGTIANDISLLFVALSCALFVGNVVSATNFSRAIRREIDPTSVKAPFARGFFGFGS